MNDIAQKINRFIKRCEKNNIFLICCIILSISIVFTAFAKSNIFEKLKVIKDNNLEIAMINNNVNEIILAKNGDTNIGNGGGNGDYDTAKGDYTILDNEQDEGVRVTLVESETNNPVTTPMDFANNPRQPIQKYLGGGNKLYYLKNQKISLYDGNGYKFKKPFIALPKIICGNLSTIKKYFGDEGFLKYFSEQTNFSYEEMISGKYKLMLEPVGYPKIAGKVTACTATELAILDKMLNGKIRKSAIQNFSHMNLPFAMFLERDEFGIKAYIGSTVSKQKDDTIISQLGVGAITFVPEEPEEPSVIPPSYEYRTNTDVYTSIEISGINCLLYYKNKEIKNPVYVTFEIDGKNYSANNNGLVFKDKGIAYVKWHTPTEEQEMTIKATVSYNIVAYTEQGTPYLKRVENHYDIGVKIVELKEKVPPNPDADDKNEKFTLKEPEKIEEDNKELTWVEYELNQESISPNGKDIITKWIWTTYEYKAYLGIFLNFYPDPLCKTYSEENYDLYHDNNTNTHIQRIFYKMKSGYGIREKIESKLLIEKTTKVKHLDDTFEEYTEIIKTVGIPPQNAINYFSDFD